MKNTKKIGYKIVFYGWVLFNVGCIIYTVVDIIGKIIR